MIRKVFLTLYLLIFKFFKFLFIELFKSFSYNYFNLIKKINKEEYFLLISNLIIKVTKTGKFISNNGIK